MEKHQNNSISWLQWLVARIVVGRSVAVVGAVASLVEQPIIILKRLKGK